MSDEPIFTPHGKISALAACEQIILRLEPKDGITVDQAIDDVEELCEYRHTRETVQDAMRQASARLLAHGQLGVTTEHNGWQRMDDSAAIGQARRHAERGRRQVVKTVHAAAASNPERLTWSERGTRDHMLRLQEAERVMRLRRTRKLRPVEDEPEELAG